MFVKIWPFAGTFSFTNFTDEDKEVKTLWGWIKYARFHYFIDEGEDYGHVDGIEWSFRTRVREWSLAFVTTFEEPFADDRDVLVNVEVGPFVLFLGWRNSLKRTRANRERRGRFHRRTRRFGIDASSRGIYFHIGDNPYSWSSSDPKWWNFSLHPVDLILGKRVFTSTTIKEVDDFVFLPEGLYPATAKLNRDTWKRKRFPFWPFTKTMLRGDVEMHIPIPIPGKGESSYDIEDDAYYSEYGPAMSVEHALGNIANSAMDTRVRYAGEGWVPDDGWPEDILRPPRGHADLYKDEE